MSPLHAIASCSHSAAQRCQPCTRPVANSRVARRTSRALTLRHSVCFASSLHDVACSSPLAPDGYGRNHPARPSFHLCVQLTLEQSRSPCDCGAQASTPQELLGGDAALARHRLTEAAEEAIAASPTESASAGVDKLVWKCAYHGVVTRFRHLSASTRASEQTPADAQHVTTLLSDFLDEGIGFYAGLLECVGLSALGHNDASGRRSAKGGGLLLGVGGDNVSGSDAGGGGADAVVSHENRTGGAGVDSIHDDDDDDDVVDDAVVTLGHRFFVSMGDVARYQALLLPSSIDGRDRRYREALSAGFYRRALEIRYVLAPHHKCFHYFWSGKQWRGAL
jgi:hypothetical protein